MNSQVQKPRHLPGCYAVIPFDNPEVLNYVRIAYAVTQLTILAVYYYVTMVVKRKNDQTVLKYVEPASPMSPDQEPKLITQTVRDYDLTEVSKLVCLSLPTIRSDYLEANLSPLSQHQLRSVYIGIAMMAFLHGYMKFTQPLFIQSLMGLKGLYDAKPVSIHILGKNDKEGDLKRPWKAAPGMFGGECYFF
ncbi:hypothetical protein D9758_018768 [Tetrapyrgos nigripes]|uniref:Uncharacterized protein n=1 Tax=Tetrapyrgos nigripes TaxID=182062 RepID=A0A8H5AWN8_9AGAR|nr:hypothetical protein D9758_018768 [Tetrapyrgos nigripes]